MQPSGHVHISFILFREICAPNGLYHADHREGLVAGYAPEPGGAGRDSSAQRVLPGPESSCCGFADYSDRCLLFDFLLGKRTAREQRNAECVEVLVRYAVENT